MPRKKVLLVDQWNCDSLMEIPRLFRQAGCSVDVFSRKRSWALKGRYHDRWVPASDDPSLYIEQLKKLAAESSYDWIVLGDDLTARMLARDSTLDAALAAQLLPLSKLENVDVLGSKAGLSRACTRYGIPTPAYAIYDPSLDAEALVAQVSFPLVLKVDESAGGAGVFLCKSVQDVHAALAKLGPKEKEHLVFQKYVAGDNVAVEAIYKNGMLVTYACSVVTKTISGDFGVSAERRYESHPEIEERLRLIGSSLGIHGFCSMTFMRANGEHWLIETDLRPQAWYSLAALGGTDFSRGIREFLSDAPQFVRPEFANGLASQAVVRHFPRDLLWHAEKREYAGLWLWFRNAEGRWRSVPWRDPRLLGSILWCGTKYYGRRLFARGNGQMHEDVL